MHCHGACGPFSQAEVQPTAINAWVSQTRIQAIFLLRAGVRML
jgi:hypothetical protein